MRHFFVGIVAVLCCVACGNAQGGKGTADKGNAAHKTIVLSQAEFEQRVAKFTGQPAEWKYLGDKPAIVDFYATWCGPCRRLAPILEELAAEYEGQIYIYKVDTDKAPDLARAFGIRSIPSLLFVPLTGTPQMGQGLIPKKQLKEAIDSFLLKKQ